MEGEELVNICQAVMHGNSRTVRNVRSRECGVIVRCFGNHLEVDLENRREVWKGGECEEVMPQELMRPV